MKNSAQKNKSTTQKFIEIQNITDDIVLFDNGNAALVIEITATNFALLSKDEQEAKVAAYASLLNSLPFSIQIFIRNKQLDISSYVKLLETQEREQQNQIIKERIRLYREFVSELVKVNTVLDKNFYIVLSFSPLEGGLAKAASSVKKAATTSEALASSAKTSLHSKAESLRNQLASLNLRARKLEKGELASLFYEIYNSEAGVSQADIQTQPPVVKTGNTI